MSNFAKWTLRISNSNQRKGTLDNRLQHLPLGLSELPLLSTFSLLCFFFHSFPLQFFCFILSSLFFCGFCCFFSPTSPVIWLCNWRTSVIDYILLHKVNLTLETHIILSLVFLTNFSVKRKEQRGRVKSITIEEVSSISLSHPLPRLSIGVGTGFESTPCPQSPAMATSVINIIKICFILIRGFS